MSVKNGRNLVDVASVFFPKKAGTQEMKRVSWFINSLGDVSNLVITQLLSTMDIPVQI